MISTYKSSYIVVKKLKKETTTIAGQKYVSSFQ